MDFNIEQLIKKIIYRSIIVEQKMDKLLGSFTKEYINNLETKDLIDLEKLLEFDDNNLYNFYNGLKTEVKFENNKINCYLRITSSQNELSKVAERLGLNPGKSCPFAGFQDRCFQPLSHLSLKKLV